MANFSALTLAPPQHTYESQQWFSVFNPSLSSILPITTSIPHFHNFCSFTFSARLRWNQLTCYIYQYQLFQNRHPDMTKHTLSPRVRQLSIKDLFCCKFHFDNIDYYNVPKQKSGYSDPDMSHPPEPASKPAEPGTVWHRGSIQSSGEVCLRDNQSGNTMIHRDIVLTVVSVSTCHPQDDVRTQLGNSGE